MKNINELRLKKRKSIATNFQQTQVNEFTKILNELKLNSYKEKRIVNILEIGCSYGFWLDIVSLIFDSNIVGVDIYNSIAPSLLSSKVKFVIGDGCRLPFKHNSFDIVYHIDVIEHIEQVKLFLSENYRVLKRDGICILGTPNRTRLSAILKMLLLHPNRYPLQIRDEIFGYVTHIREYTFKDIQKLINITKFKILKIIPIYLGLPYGIIDKICWRYPKLFFKKFAQFFFLVMKK